VAQFAKGLIVIGVVLVGAGVLLYAASRLGLGRLPGDLTWRTKGGVEVHFPLATSILLSVLLTLLLNLWFGRSR
jgi:hypothetical protein